MRFERKYFLKHLDLSLVQQVLRMHPASFRKSFPDRQVNNVYFDSPEMRIFNDTVNGISERRKFRLRWYGGNMTEAKTPVFEIKVKNNQLGKKISRSFDGFFLKELIEVTVKVNELSRTPAVLQPVLINSYQRCYYSTTDGNFRITIDSGLSFWPCTKRSLSGKGYESAGIIVELKYEAELDDLRDRITQFLPFRQTKNSKYVSGVLMINGAG